MIQTSNQDIARILSEMAVLLEMEGVQFKPRAYEKVAQEITTLDTEIADLYKKSGRGGLLKIPWVGEGILDHI